MTALKRILLVEDSPNDVELTLAALAESNLANEVMVATDGADALDYLYARGRYRLRYPVLPVVVLLDLKLPKVDGLEVLRTIRADPRLQKIPVVVLTSSRQESDLVSSYELGASAFVVKPVAFDRFLEALKVIGVFWGVVNQPPPAGEVPEPARETHAEVSPS
jgi:CheY-like chemotaxis protein